MKPIIEARHISKRYKIGAAQNRYLSLRDSISNFRKYIVPQEHQFFWALDDLSFDVMPGECLGVVGNNGAGKSTLLKILSRITPPSKGKIKMRGRVASLLEVGTGFHPELSGRENIYLNGSILGMSRMEINQSFDEIIYFSGIEKFLDTPLKHYSSGMQLRLAFSVAAHLKPEILLIDEVLAVGDAAFQKKCLGKMDEVSKSGRTVIFVSHDLDSVVKLCPKILYLEGGKLKNIGRNTDIIQEYLSNLRNQNKGTLIRQGSKEISVENILFLQQSKKQDITIRSMEYVLIQMECKASEEMKNVEFSICFNNIHNHRITSIWSAFIGQSYDVKKGKFTVNFKIENLHLIPGQYQITSYINQGNRVIERVDDFMIIDILPSFNESNTRIPTLDQGVYMESFTSTMQSK